MSDTIVIDEVIVICNSCKLRRSFKPCPLLTSIAEFQNFMAENVRACPDCGYDKAEVRLHIPHPN